MHPRNRWFVTLSLLYALLGGLIGIVRIAQPGWIAGDAARLHGHVMLLGYVTMMIYGIGLHVLPRFSGRALFSERLADWQLVLANAGLWLMAAGWWRSAHGVVVLGGALTWLAMGAFAANVLFTVRHYGPGD